MKFSVCFEAQMVDTSRESEQRTFYEAVDQAVYAEKMGLDGIWAVEHHALTQYAHMSAEFASAMALFVCRRQ
jgi:alkanesulfonate monooxygenase SsuD/methylene tetrahydromethanopterin reductase-like flavin-dependent oxidoreductase (luciferase family)